MKTIVFQVGITPYRYASDFKERMEYIEYSDGTHDFASVVYHLK
jgi:hypothetical protein